MKKLIILRGLQGSGKSTLADDIARGNDASILGLDKYHYEHDVYKYDPSQTEKYESLRETSCIALMNTDKPMIIIDGANYAKEHVMKYVRLGEKFGYQITILEIPHQDPNMLAVRNIHGVPRERILKTIYRWDSLGYRAPFGRFFYQLKKRLQFWKKRRFY